MFDAKSFVRKNAKSLSTPVIAHGFKMKLAGWTDDTKEALATLAKSQVKDVKLTEDAEEVEIDGSITRRPKQAVMEPAKTALLILGKEEEAPKKEEERGNRNNRQTVAVP